MITAMSVYECVSEDVDLLMIVVLMKENFDELIIIDELIIFLRNQFRCDVSIEVYMYVTTSGLQRRQGSQI
jgi:hypothetical protein